jgi:predicted benzoate:H+ symporter BenE
MLQNALEKAFEAKLRFGAVVAFVVATTTFSILGLAHWTGDAA